MFINYLSGIYIKYFIIYINFNVQYKPKIIKSSKNIYKYNFLLYDDLRVMIFDDNFNKLPCFPLQIKN